jgi:hypothetical protein
LDPVVVSYLVVDKIRSREFIDLQPVHRTLHLIAHGFENNGGSIFGGAAKGWGNQEYKSPKHQGKIHIKTREIDEDKICIRHIQIP